MQVASCAGKKAYRNYSKAEQIVKRYHKRCDHADGHMQVYRCRHCQAWHVGGGEEWKSRKSRRRI